MVVWTKLAQNAAGGKESMNALVDLAVLETNLAYEDSGVNSRLRLVYKAKIGYGENGSFSDHLYDLQGTNDGVMDEVHAIVTQSAPITSHSWCRTARTAESRSS